MYREREASNEWSKTQASLVKVRKNNRLVTDIFRAKPLITNNLKIGDTRRQHRLFITNYYFLTFKPLFNFFITKYTDISPTYRKKLTEYKSPLLHVKK